MMTTADRLGRHGQSRPRASKFHMFPNENSERFVLDVESGKISELPNSQYDAVATALKFGDQLRAELIALGPNALAKTPSKIYVPRSIGVKAFSLAIAQKCNLGCTYCYAQQGTFGGKAANMPLDIAKRSVDRLLDETSTGDRITLAFMGGEPLMNRTVLHAVTRYAAAEASARGVAIGFTMTTNATLFRREDIDLFQEFRFTLTVSIDGLQETNDQLRPMRSGRGSFERVAKGIIDLLAQKKRSFRVFARVTVTPSNINLSATMTGLLDMGFDSIMFSPMLQSPTGKGEMLAADFDRLLDELIKCGQRWRDQLEQDQILPFANLITTIKRIHICERDQYPCGAGGGYMAVSAEGGLSACHRFINEADGNMGNIEQGVDAEKQAAWLNERHLQRQSPCTSCWARHLCAGSCHFEVLKRGRPACDYIRGWLEYCLQTYVELKRDHPRTLQTILN